MKNAEGSKPAQGDQPRVPRWVRAILALDRLALKAVSLEAGVRDELLWAWTPPGARDALTAAMYATQGTYKPGGEAYVGGLLAWEREALRDEAFTARRRWLVGGAGGGRELFALMELGCSVLAFEPCEPLCRSAQNALGDRANGQMRLASYDDLVRASQGLGGPLWDVAAWGADAVMLGWGSFTHVLTAEAREALLRAVRTVAPEAPVLLSFLPRAESDAGLISRARKVVHAASRSLGAPGSEGAWAAGRGFVPHGGFIARLTEREVRETASSAGYSVVRLAMRPYPHAVLRPLARQ